METVLQKTSIESEVPEAELEITRKRVYVYQDNIIYYKELVNPNPLQIKLAVERVQELGKKFESFSVIIDLTETKPPNPEQRNCLKKAWSQVQGVQHLTAFTEKNFLLNMAAKFVSGTFGKSFSVHKNLKQCLKKIEKIHNEKQQKN